MIYDKILSRVRIEGAYLNRIKAICGKTSCQPHNQWTETTSVSFKIGKKTRVSAFTILIQHSTACARHNDQTRGRNKRHPNWKGSSKTVLIHRCHHSVHRKLSRLHEITTGPNKGMRQSSGIESQ